MRFLFVKARLNWPLTSGHDVHAYHMMQALANAQHAVALLTLDAPSGEATRGLKLVDQRCLPAAPEGSAAVETSLGHGTARMRRGSRRHRQEKFRTYWGIEEHHVRYVESHAQALDIDVVVVVGIEVLPYLAGVRGRQRIWYAADEWVWHHLSLVNWRQPHTWNHVRTAAIMGLYERSFANLVDRAWVVSTADRRALRLVSGIPAIDLVPNGVDTAKFSPTDDPPVDFSCAFWGNLGFIPNEDALAWFCETVWPLVLHRVPDARFTIFGSTPSPRVRALSVHRRIELVPDVPDIPEAVRRHAVVVLPFRSGGGIKNKLLEAAALGKPVVCSVRACNGLELPSDVPFEVLPLDATLWADTLSALWHDRARRQRLGQAARDWVVGGHTWQSAADRAISALRPAVADDRSLPP